MDATVKFGQPKVPAKKAYLKPFLQVYGSIEKITQRTGVGVHGDNPNKKGPMTHTG